MHNLNNITVIETSENKHCFYMDVIDLVVNPHYNTVESSFLRYALEQVGIERETYRQIDGGVGSNSQYVIIETTDEQVDVLIKLAFKSYKKPN